jgi:hypothetical protein
MLLSLPMDRITSRGFAISSIVRLRRWGQGAVLLVSLLSLIVVLGVTKADRLEVHIGTPIPICQAENERRLASKDTSKGIAPTTNDDTSNPAPARPTSTTQTEAYVPATFDNLVYRYEEPNAMARWDSPLFTVLRDDEQPPCEAIWDAMIGSDGKGRVVRSNAATVLVCLFSPIFTRSAKG